MENHLFICRLNISPIIFRSNSYQKHIIAPIIVVLMYLFNNLHKTILNVTKMRRMKQLNRQIVFDVSKVDMNTRLILAYATTNSQWIYTLKGNTFIHVDKDQRCISKVVRFFSHICNALTQYKNIIYICMNLIFKVAGIYNVTVCVLHFYADQLTTCSKNIDNFVE